MGAAWVSKGPWGFMREVMRLEWPHNGQEGCMRDVTLLAGSWHETLEIKIT